MFTWTKLDRSSSLCFCNWGTKRKEIEIIESRAETGRKEGTISQLGAEFESPILWDPNQFTTGLETQPIPQIYADKIQKNRPAIIMP